MPGGSGTAEAARRSRTADGGRRGSRFSDKQIAHAVKDRRAVRILTTCGDEVTGFVYGMDDYHLGIVTLTGDKALVHKAAAAVIQFVDDPGYPADEDAPLRSICEPFRQRVMKELFGQETSDLH